MSTSPGGGKRKRTTLSSRVSPPPSRRKLQSSTTKSAIASFFTPSSQKAPEKLKWQERAYSDQLPNTLLVGKHVPTDTSPTLPGLNQKKKKRIAAFDFDSTLITTVSGKKSYSSESNDWKWWHPSVPGKLRQLYTEEGYLIAVVSNQAGLSLKTDPKGSGKRLNTFKDKASAVLNQLDMPIIIYAATEKDIYRKPRMGMWTELLDDCKISSDDLDLEHSIFVGDAAGRHAEAGKAKDFSCSDRNFAGNIGLKFYTPEEFFLDEVPRAFSRTFEPSEFLPNTAAEVIAPFSRNSPQDLVVFVGSPGAGKSTFYWHNLQPLGYERVNQDILKTRERCLKVAEQYLIEGKSVAVDNTNADSEVRRRWIELAAKRSVPVRCVHFTAAAEICEHNDAVRALNSNMNPEKRSMLPSVAFRGYSSRYQPPKIAEGFEDITEVSFKFEGKESERNLWMQYWT
ncbi:HAD-like protein [Glarea lozoyensis ATCC 20868]|uniref:HAD-like protein n=1 Tax=Glarea lozoyensis (strain ATCC 20868 / MF5171) TaxID=1116229 RepID=S3DI60_GLAL2|nr:HAD-like protein [Glarea lozoyensis ATCC 20868]EPE36814.1 HAD-like protein [Glarea lozoyensis ATCC 20868]